MNQQYKQQADQLIDAYSFKKWNEITSGSYYLDLMVCPDLDLYFEAVGNKLLFSMAEEIYTNDFTNELYVMKGKKLDLPLGEHLQVRTNLVVNGTALIQKNGFTPKYSSYHVYKAFLYHGIREISQIKEYLRSKNIVFS